MAGLNGKPIQQVEYDTEAFNFRGDMERILGSGLENLHRDLGSVSLLDREHDQSTAAHQLFYYRFGYIDPTYKRFIRQVVQPLFEEPVVYQRVPTFRVHLPGNVAVGEYHRDRDYSHNPEAVNFWLPFTDAWGSNSVQIENKGRRKPMYVKYGHLLIFDGMNLLHGNEINQTGKTRVSMDFRVIPKSKFVPSERQSINTHLPMDIGGYYADQLSS